MSRSSSSSASTVIAAAQDEDSVRLLEKEEEYGEYHHPVIARQRWRYLPLLVVLLIITNLIAVFVCVNLYTSAQHPLNQPPGGAAPVLAELVRSPRPTQLSQPFWNNDHDPLREHDSDAADDAWEDYVTDSEH